MGKLSEYKTFVTCKCKICEKEWDVPKHRGHATLCSRKCIGEYIKSKRISIKCQECNKDFRVTKFIAKTRKFCSKKCDDKNRSKTSSGNNNPNWRGGDIRYNCKHCGEEAHKRKSAYNNSKHHFCSRSCQSTFNVKRGEDNHMWTGGMIGFSCDYCNKKVKRSRSRYDRAEYHFCSKECGNKHRVETDRYGGENNPTWMGGISFEPYSLDWTRKLKKRIRERDGYRCRLCEKNGNIVHHVDYDKKNCDEVNLITLCRSCHGKTCFKREYWIQHFKELIQWRYQLVGV